MKKILILGAKGMLGQELVKTFRKDSDYKVIGWDREDIDIASEKEVSKKIGIIKPSIIINAAAYNAVDKCEEDKKEFELAKKINGLAPGYLAKVAKKLKATLVHYSTDYVFNGQPEINEPQGCTHVCATCSLHGGEPEVGFCEDDKPDPINKYAETKLLGEKEVQKNLKNYYIIRLSWLFGKPAISKNAKRSFFDIMLELGGKNKEVRAVDDETGQFTYAPDLVIKTKEIIDSKKPFGIYHVTNSDPCSWYEAAIELYKQAGLKTKVIPVTGDAFPRPAKRPFYSVLVNTKLNPMRSYKEALKEYLKGIK
ncbi:MAG: dTDP-4-dehydrorhamnose reductase [Parcubacteria group bacterium]|jgi:dTDP-4-dehydrorhamnose reductase